MAADTGDEPCDLEARQRDAERDSIRDLEVLCRAALHRESPVAGDAGGHRRATRRRFSPIESGAGARFLERTLVPLAEAIAADALAIQAGSGRLPAYAAALLALHPETLALLALRIIYNRATTGRRPGYAEVAVAIGKACHAEWRVRRGDAKRRITEAEWRHAAAEALETGEAIMADHDPGASPPEDGLPDLQKLLAARNRNRNAAARARQQAERFEASDWRDAGAIELGGRLLDLAEGCALVTIAGTLGGGGVLRRVDLAPALTRRDTTADAAARLLAMSPLLPMLVPPGPRAGREGGGFLTAEDPDLVCLVKDHGHKKSVAALDAAEGAGTMGTVLAAVNALQDTAWRLNRPLVALLAHAWAEQLPLPGLPDRARLAEVEEQLARPDEAREALRARGRAIRGRGERARAAATLAVPVPDDEREALRALRAALRRDWGEYREGRGSVGAQLRERTTLRSRHRQHEALLATCAALVGATPDDGAGHLYFPYQLDYRGRAYAMVATPSPQGGDAARAALEFADGKALGPTGERWLAVHLANTHGQDKIPFSAREAWVRSREGVIRDLARLLDPAAGAPAARLAVLGEAARELWAGAEEPWQFLAACREWATRGDPGFVSRLPVALDGSASGYQHLSALARDRAGAEATNLLDREVPADLYVRVVHALRERVEGDARAGNAAAAAWLDPATGEADRVTRNAIKRGVMTTPYGVTRGGLRRQILGHLETEQSGALDEPWQAADYLAGALRDGIGAVVGNAPAVMTWLQDVATALFTEYGRGVAWTTPAGFPVIVEHYREKPRVVRWTPPGQKRREITLRVPDPEGLGVDLRKQRSTIAPNFVHALDAAHMMLTIRRLHGEGLRHFAAIHDSYGVHACDVPRLRRALREEFVGMYRAPLLEQFIDAQIDALPKGISAASPEAETNATPGRKRAVSFGPRDSTSPDGAKKEKKGKKSIPTLLELRESLPPPGNLAIEEVLGARYMFG